MLIPRVIAVAKSTLHNPSEAATKTAIQQNHGAIGFYKTGFFELAGEAGRTDEAPRRRRERSWTPCRTTRNSWKTTLLPKAKGDWRLGKDKFYPRWIWSWTPG